MRTLNTGDATGTVRIVIHLVERRGRHAKGNRSRVLTVRDARVSGVAAILETALKHSLSGKQVGGQLPRDG